MSDFELYYRLPVTALQFTGTVTTTVDTVLGGDPTTTPNATIAITTIASANQRRLVLENGLLRDSTASIVLTEDSRLTSTDLTTTGQVGKTIVGIVGAAAHVAALAAPALLAALAQPAAAGTPDEELTPEQKVAAAYAAASNPPGSNRDVAEARASYAGLVQDAIEKIAELGPLLLTTEDAAERKEVLRQLTAVEQQLPIWSAQLDKLNAHFQAWRQTTLKQTTESHSATLSLDHLRNAGARVENGVMSFEQRSEWGPTAAERWARFGLMATIPYVTPKEIPNPGDKNTIVVVIPRTETLSIWQREGDRAVLVQKFQQLVVDDACATRTFTLDSSWFSRREMSLRFSDLGALTGISGTADSSAAAVAGLLGQLPGTVAGAVGDASKLRTAWSGLKNAGLDAELARVRSEVDLRTQQQSLAGLAATDADYAKLETLKQQADVVTQLKTLGDALPDSARDAALAQELAAVKAQLAALQAATALGGA